MLFVRVAGLLGLEGLLLLSSNYNLFSKIKAFGGFSESLFISFKSAALLREVWFFFNIFVFSKRSRLLVTSNAYISAINCKVSAK